MNNLNNVLELSSPKQLHEYLCSCKDSEDLVTKLEKDPTQLFSFVQHMKIEGNEQMAARLLYKLAPQQLENPVIKQVETALRNRLMLKRSISPNIALQLQKAGQIGELKAQCDEKLCNSIGIEFTIEESELPDWLALDQLCPKFVQLLSFINKQAGEGSLEPIIDQMQNPAEAALLADKCTPQEIELFSTLKTEFGKACQIPPGTFGKAEWEKVFPVTINEVPPLPPNIHAILELDDPTEPDKKLKETCQLFLRPEKVILHEAGRDKELMLSFDGVEELFMNATDPSLRIRTFNELRAQMNRMRVAGAGWVLMRKEIIPGSEGQSFENQKKLLKGVFEMPKVIDALLLNILTYVSEGKYLEYYPWIYTRCQEQFCRGNVNYQTIVGGFSRPSGLDVDYDFFNLDNYGLSAAWKF